MMKKYNLFKISTLITFAFFMISCQNTDVAKEKPLEVVEESSEKEAVRETLIAMWKAIEDEDINEYAKHVHLDFTQFGEYDAVLREGKDAEVKGIKGWLDESDTIHTEMIDPKVTINGNTAWLTYYWSDNGTTNGKPFSSKGKSTRIFVKENGKWLCIHGHYTLLP